MTRRCGWSEVYCDWRNTLSDVAHPLLESIEFPEPPVSIAVEPKSKGRPGKDMALALQRLAEEDPTFRIHRRRNGSDNYVREWASWVPRHSCRPYEVNL